MRLTFLGTGTSMGVPIIGCTCAVCRSCDRRDRRLRTSALLTDDKRAILIDAGPDFREQALSVGLDRLDAVLLTHAHADHIAGLDDLRPLNFRQQAAMPLYGDDATLTAVRERYAYAFGETSSGSTRPVLALEPLTYHRPFAVAGLEVVPLPVQHGSWTISGFRVGNLGYVTDASALAPETLAALRGLDILVLNALRIEPHPTHFSLAEALAVVEQLGPRLAFFVHISHELGHAAGDALLPDHVRLAYDGLTVEIR